MDGNAPVATPSRRRGTRMRVLSELEDGNLACVFPRVGHVVETVNLRLLSELEDGNDLESVFPSGGNAVESRIDWGAGNNETYAKTHRAPPIYSKAYIRSTGAARHMRSARCESPLDSPPCCGFQYAIGEWTGRGGDVVDVLWCCRGFASAAYTVEMWREVPSRCPKDAIAGLRYPKIWLSNIPGGTPVECESGTPQQAGKGIRIDAYVPYTGNVDS
ncbi:hypothetical protein JR316_0008714 [Psilocybe cubensis]|uniref:Uncharacterized protein n=3 Tax=Psilocybe cubensis TaxID=181762 RepID=A0ACB8GRS4_PSICU|nr:uncharacterized protein JR316_0013521 [Psilocybe cubensis]XP_047745886.1 hypothetical protein JR316_0008714 [Psilocybe cubensis]KAH9474171.1 hypothetical protein JR316_0013521 [Psilocybe cubensis]KAH9478261.1 hypothetical protein JR316_0008714 [Psilocybe cubensis]